jgi:hypothetical protein
MPRKRTEPKSPSRSRAIATRARDARGRVLPKTVPTEALPAICPFCGGVVPCLADRERKRLEGQQVTDAETGAIYTVSQVGHLKNNSDVLARVKGYSRLILTSRLR